MAAAEPSGQNLPAGHFAGGVVVEVQKVPPAHFTAAADPPGQNVPLGQIVAASAPSGQNAPAGQFLQVAFDVEPSTPLKEPARHGVHASLDEAPVTLLK
jgi:hypothetical protein